MIIDAQNRFSNAQVTTTGTGSASAPGVRSTNIIDLLTERRIGIGEPLFVVAMIATALTSSGSNDAMDVWLYSAADGDEAFASATKRQLIGTFPAVSAIGTTIASPIRPLILTERYLGLYYISQTTDAFTAGAVTSFLTRNIDAYVAYPDAVTIH